MLEASIILSPPETRQTQETTLLNAEMRHALKSLERHIVRMDQVVVGGFTDS